MCVKDNETNNILRVTCKNQELCVQAIISYAYENDFISLTRARSELGIQENSDKTMGISAREVPERV